MKLYSPQGHYKTNIILAISSFTKHTIQLVPSAFNNSPSKQFLKKHPTAKLPALQTEQGFVFGLATIVRYLTSASNNSLKEKDPFAKSSVDQWIDLAESEVDSKAGILYLQVFGIVKYDKEKWDFARKELLNALKFLDTSLKFKTYLAGDKLSSADIIAAGFLQVSFKLLLDPKARAQHPHLSRWFSNISSLPPFIDAFGLTHLCQEEFRFPVQ